MDGHCGDKKKSKKSVLHCLLWEIIQSPYLGKAQQLQEQLYPFLSVCAVFSCVQTMVWLPVFGIFNVCAQMIMLMHAIAHGGCTETVRESALEVDSGRKIPCCTGDSNPREYCARAFQSDALPTELLPAPFSALCELADIQNI